MNVTMALASPFRLLHVPPQLAKSLLFGGVALLVCVILVYTFFPIPFSKGAQHLALRSFDVHPAQT